MRVIPATILGACALLSLSAQAANSSFNCSQATHEAEQMICRDAELASLDRSLTGLYNSLLRNLPKAEQRTLRAEQRGWIKGRNDCWKSSDQRGCIKSAYEDRIRELKDR